jgi:hypothetical protein
MSKKCQMSQSVSEAYLLLNRMRDNAERFGRGFYWIERIEQAIDYLLNDPGKVGPPRILVRDVMGNAGVKLRYRINLLKETAELAGLTSIVTMSLEGDSSIEHLRLEILDEIEHSPIDQATKDILVSLYHDKCADELANEEKVSLGTMTTRICRARSKFFKVRREAV